MPRTVEGLDLFSAVSAAAQGVARTLRSDGVSAVLLWGDPPEAEVVYRQGLPVVLCRALGTAGGRALGTALRRAGRPLLVEPAAVKGEAPEMAAALESHGIPALAAFPLYAEAGVVGCMVVPVPEGTDLSAARHDWRVACRSLAALQLAAAVAALRALLSEDRRQPAGWADGVLVFDQWERVLFADGFFREFPGWNREDPFGRALGMMAGGVLLTGMKPSHPGNLVWEEHLLPPVARHGMPVALACLPLDVDRTGTPNARLVLVRDLRPDEDRGPDPSTRLLALGMRVAHAADELLQAVADPSAASEGAGPLAVRHGRAVAEEAPQVVEAALARVKGTQERRLVDLGKVATDVLHRFSGEMEAERIRVLRFMAPDLPGVPGDALDIARSVRAMVRSARRSLRPGGGTLTVRTWAQEEFAWVAVSDDGSGDGLSTHDGFLPLFPETEDGAHDLADVAALAEAMGGRLLTETHKGLWHRVTLTLPMERRAAPRDEEAGADAHQDLDDSDGLRVLVVDDNAALRSVLRRYLERRGHRVTEAVDGDDALGIVRGRGFDRVILDVNMPGKTGPELYACMLEVTPAMCQRTIFMTGGSLEPSTEDFIEGSGRPSIKKPFDLMDLARKVEAG